MRLEGLIKKLMTSDEWPDRKFSEECYKHNLTVLLRVAGLDGLLASAGPGVGTKWGQVKDWSEQSRYEYGRTDAEVRQFYDAISDSTDGVLTWIQHHW
jgi:hypothetical protein